VKGFDSATAKKTKWIGDDSDDSSIALAAMRLYQQRQLCEGVIVVTAVASATLMPLLILSIIQY
jgi:hypothetical protein